MHRTTVFLLIMLLALPASTPAQQSAADALIAAAEDDRPDRPIGINIFETYPAPPAREALGDELYAEYVAAIERRECETAERLIRLDYLNRYPEIAQAFTNDSVKIAWHVRIFQHVYPNAALCVAVESIKREVARLRATGHPVPPAKTIYFNRQQDRALFERDHHARTVEALARNEYTPAMQAYLLLEDDGIVHLSAKDRLYHLFRLERLGHPLPDQEDRIERATRSMFPADIRNTRCWAEVEGGAGLPASLDTYCKP